MLILPGNRQGALLAKQKISVGVDGELVVLNLGNVEVKMPYATAIQLSQWLRVKGKQAKMVAGDSGRHWSVLGVLEDLKQ